MQPPMAPPPPAGGPAAAPAKSYTTLFGVLGLVFSICGGLLGIVFGALSIWQAKKHGQSPVLGIVAIVLSVIFGIIWIVVRSSNG
jgi:hypothetical protein